jgi:OmcA/MtrC family decaheme c-type cytochrome
MTKAAAITFRLAIVTLFALTLTGAGRINKEIYNKNEKARFAPDALVGLATPGFNLAVNSASVAANGTMTAVVTITDTAGLPIDIYGITTPGVCALSFTMGYIPANAEQYTSYVTSSSTGAAGTFVRPSSENAITTTTGKLTPLGNGQYQYVFGNKAPANFDQTATHTLAAWGSRTLAPYGLPNEFASATFNFVPNGSKVTKIRDVVSTAACDGCHDQLSEHGGSRRGVAVCVMCHTPAMIDSGTGESIDFKVYIHKIHIGSSLPSVATGSPNLVAGSDFSTVVYPADVRRCETCHDPKTATQANLYNTNPSAEACGACHDDVNFASGVNHAGGPQPDNSMCAQCHIPQGELEFDASVKGAHTIPTNSSYLTGFVVNLSKVTNSLAGQKPTVAFTIQDKNGNGIGFPAGGTISLTMAGPTSDYGYTNFGAAVTTPGYVTESVPASACDNNGNCSYSFTNPVPSGATGTYAIGVEARRTETILPGTTSSQSVEYGATNKVVYFSVDGSPVAPRRQVVAEANCNRCHAQLSEHGTLRNQVEYCVLCHNPSNTDSSTRPSATVAAQKNLPNQGIAFDLLVHRIHTGLNLPTIAPGRDYTVVGYGGSINDFTNAFASVPASITNTGVRFPAMDPTGAVHDTANCSMCHIGPGAVVTTLNGSTTPLTLGTETILPLGLNAVTDPQGPIPSDPAITAACTGCHASISTASHALANTTTLGESCIACHGSSANYSTLGLDYSVQAVHSQY